MYILNRFERHCEKPFHAIWGVCWYDIISFWLWHFDQLCTFLLRLRLLIFVFHWVQVPAWELSCRSWEGGAATVKRRVRCDPLSWLIETVHLGSSSFTLNQGEKAQFSQIPSFAFDFFQRLIWINRYRLQEKCGQVEAVEDSFKPKKLNRDVAFEEAALKKQWVESGQLVWKDLSPQNEGWGYFDTCCLFSCPLFFFFSLSAVYCIDWKCWGDWLSCQCKRM